MRASLSLLRNNLPSNSNMWSFGSVTGDSRRSLMVRSFMCPMAMSNAVVPSLASVSAKMPSTERSRWRMSFWPWCAHIQSGDVRPVQYKETLVFLESSYSHMYLFLEQYLPALRTNDA